MATPDFYPITGRKNTGGVFDRIPVEEMQKDEPYQFALFILGYAAVKGNPIDHGFDGVQVPGATYMEIAGIHGRPYREYAGDPRTPAEKSTDFDRNDKKDTLPVPSRFGGYCNHASITFPTWHRPYVMLIEQAIGDFADEMAKSIEAANPAEVGRWVPAAKKLRFPYWDWAEPKVSEEGMPRVFLDEYLDIMFLGGRTKSVKNPLTRFTFPYIPDDFQDVTRVINGQTMTAYFTQWSQTYRHAPSSPQGSDNIQELQTQLKAIASDLRTKVAHLFTFPDGQNPEEKQVYDEFSNTLNESRRQMDYSNSGSLEGVHNSIHGTIGGNGHMGNPDYAAFDPFFFFHHANVDRLLA